MAEVDNSSWDGPAAMSACAGMDDPAAAYEAICAGRRAGDPALQSSWALPHHKMPDDPPNADGVRSALSRLPQTDGLTNRDAAQKHLDAHMAEVSGDAEPDADEAGRARPPRDYLTRANSFGNYELRDDGGESMPTLAGHFAVFDQWTEINSVFEGQFIERVGEGAFTKTISENRAQMRILFNHGADPSVGNKVLAPIEDIGQDQTGGYYAGRMLDTSYNRDLLPGLRANLYGSSFRFAVTKEDFVRSPKKSDYNPNGLPERTIREAQLFEFGPVTFPAYAGATAGIRSLTDEFVLGRFVRQPERFMALLETMRQATALPHGGAGVSHSDEGSRRTSAAHPITDDEWLRLLGVASDRSTDPSWLSRT